MKANTILIRGICLIAALLVPLGMAVAAPDISNLRAIAATEGEVKIIVGLRLPKSFQPEGTFPGRADVERQRQAIADAAEKFINRLPAGARYYAEWESLPYVAVKANGKALEQIARSPLVTTIQEDAAEFPDLASSTPHIGADDTFAAGFDGLGRLVVILDTGIDEDHPFFGGRIVHEACFSGNAGDASLCPDGTNSQTGLGSANAETAQCWSTVGNTTTNNICDHGTHVAGIAAGQDDPNISGSNDFSGVAPEATIIAIQVFSRENTSCSPGSAPCVKAAVSDQLSALNYVNNTLLVNWPGITAVNMSIGNTDNNATACDGDSRKAAVDNLWSNGVATVISAGNSGWTDGVGTPGCISSAVTVGGVTDPDDNVIFNMGVLVDLLAPGSGIQSSIVDDVYGSKGGTSMSAPHVTGAFAVLKAAFPSMSIGDILTHLQDTGVLVRDERTPNPASANAGHVKPRIQLDLAIAGQTEADVRVFKDCKPDQPMLVGDTATCTITVQNLGPDSSLGVIAVDEYVSNGTFDFGTITTTAGSCDSTSNPQNGAGTVTCDIGSMLSGDVATIEIDVTADDPQDINDLITVSATTPDPNPTNNVAADEVTVNEIADLEVFKDCKPDEPMLAGEVGTCFIRVKNWGPSVAKSVILKDVHVSNGNFNFGSVTTTTGSCNNPSASNPQTGGGVVLCMLGNMAAGAEVMVEVELSADDRVNINDTALAASSTFDPDTGNNSDRDGVGVAPLANLSLSKMASDNPVIAGTQLTYTLTVTNAGPSPAVNVVIEDVLPAGVTIDSVTSPDGSCNAGVPGDGSLPTTCTVDSLAVSASATMEVVVTVEPQTLGILGNNAEVFSDVFDDDNSDNLASVAVTVNASADLSVSKSDGPDPVLAGETITYDVTILNSGPSTSVDVMLADTLPAEVSLISATVSNGFGTCVPLAGSPTVVECDLNDLDPGEFVTVFMEVLVDASVAHGTTITNSATVSAGTPDPNGANDTATADTGVNAEADLAISKDASILTDNPSKRIVYTLLVTNTGPSDAQDVTVVDTLPLTPKKIVYVFDSGNGACAYDQGFHTVTCDFGTLAAGDSVSVDIVIDARGSVRVVTNTATVETSTIDPESANDTAVKEIRIKGGPGN